MQFYHQGLHLAKKVTRAKGPSYNMYLNSCLIIIIFWPLPLKEAQLVEDKNEQGEE